MAMGHWGDLKVPQSKANASGTCDPMERRPVAAGRASDFHPTSNWTNSEAAEAKTKRDKKAPRFAHYYSPASFSTRDSVSVRKRLVWARRSATNLHLRLKMLPDEQNWRKDRISCMKTISLKIFALVLSLALWGCASSENRPRATQTEPKSTTADTISSVAQERDSIYQLLAYAVVYKDWQTKSAKDGARGHNIGCVLVDPNGTVVHWALNSNGAEKTALNTVKPGRCCSTKAANISTISKDMPSTPPWSRAPCAQE